MAGCGRRCSSATGEQNADPRTHGEGRRSWFSTDRRCSRRARHARQARPEAKNASPLRNFGRQSDTTCTSGCCKDPRSCRIAPGTTRLLRRPTSSRQLLHELVEDRGIAHGVAVAVHHRDQPLLIEARGQEHAAIYTVDPLCECQVWPANRAPKPKS